MPDGAIWMLGATLLAVWWFAVSSAARDARAARERDDRELQQLHWMRQTIQLTHPNTCPPDVLVWLAEPLVPPGEADKLHLLSFQRCALACGHDPVSAQKMLLSEVKDSSGWPRPVVENSAPADASGPGEPAVSTTTAARGTAGIAGGHRCKEQRRY